MHHLEIDRLNASYDGKEQVLVDVSIQVAKGEIISLIGPSGSGKSSLLRSLMGRRAESGSGPGTHPLNWEGRQGRT